MEKLIKFAYEKGFVSKLFTEYYHIEAWSTSECKFWDEIGFYLWMCELQKWLIDKKSIIIQIMMFTYSEEDENDFGYEVIIYNKANSKEWENGINLPYSEFHEYEDALRYGCIEALRLL